MNPKVLKLQKALSFLSPALYRTKRLKALVFLLIVLILSISKLSCFSPPSPEKAPDPSNPPPPARKNINSNFFKDLDKDLADIAYDCNYKMECYWEAGHDHIEFKACPQKVSKSAGFRSIGDCHEASLTVLEDLISILKIESKRPWFRVGRISEKRRNSPSSDTDPSDPSSPEPSTPDPSNPVSPPPTPTPTAIAGFCSRTAGVQTAILGQLTGVTCSTITQANLDSIVTSLTVVLVNRARTGNTTCRLTSSLQAGDFSGLRRLRKLVLDDNCLNTLPSNIFSDMGDLEELTFGQERLLMQRLAGLMVCWMGLIG